MRLEGEDRLSGIEQIHGAPVYRLRGNLLPLVYLQQLVLQRAPQSESDDAAAKRASHIVVLQADDRQFGLVVDAIHDTEEIVVKPLQKQLKGLSASRGRDHHGRRQGGLDPGRAGRGATIGSVELPRRRTRREAGLPPDTPEEHQRLLLCRAGSSERIAVPLALVSRLEEFTQAQIEHAAGCRWSAIATGSYPGSIWRSCSERLE